MSETTWKLRSVLIIDIVGKQDLKRFAIYNEIMLLY